MRSTAILIRPCFGLNGEKASNDSLSDLISGLCCLSYDSLSQKHTQWEPAFLKKEFSLIPSGTRKRVGDIKPFQLLVGPFLFRIHQPQLFTTLSTWMVLY